MSDAVEDTEEKGAVADYLGGRFNRGTEEVKGMRYVYAG